MNTATQNGHKTARTLDDLTAEHDQAKAAVIKARAAEKTAADALTKATAAYNAARLAHTQASDRFDTAEDNERTARKARRDAERRVS